MRKHVKYSGKNKGTKNIFKYSEVICQKEKSEIHETKLKYFLGS